jgi:hypothetical protein
MGAFIFQSSEADDYLSHIGLDKEDWGSAFIESLAPDHQRELEAWTALYVESFPSRYNAKTVSPTLDSERSAPAARATTPLSASKGGPSTHVARDKWTIDDALGYFPYAYAIFRFLTDKETSPPLAISIQAPWGGGKTSLMRMIQAQLDPSYPGLRELEAASQDRSLKKATVKQIKNELDSTLHEDPLPDLPGSNEGERLTIWFNAWKYESTDQIWAGLADSIVKQVAERLNPVERELFFFRLHLRRLDTAKIRKRLTNGLLTRFFSSAARHFWIYGVAPLATLVLHLLHILGPTAPWGLWAALPNALLAVVHLWIVSIHFDNKPAELAVSDLIKAPDYDANIGFVHQVSDDLKEALKLIPTNKRPIVIFIDDLDRCSPGKVSDVIEAINLFLAGEFAHCIFVLGIDDEIVAAALNKAHSEVFGQLPQYARTASIGWRFMDKFVQLPFIMPPPSSERMNSYARSLLITSDKNGRLSLDARRRVAKSLEDEGKAEQPLEQIVEEVQQDLGLDNAEQAELKSEAETIQQMNKNIIEFTDDEEHISQLILGAVNGYSRNPRDIKRFVNSFRFYFFIRAAREARGEEVPSLEQMSRWILLSLKWPGILRWLRTGSFASRESLALELAQLEKIAEGSSISDWASGAATRMGLTGKEAEWLSDEEMLRFFTAESRRPAEERLSSSIGKGLW